MQESPTLPPIKIRYETLPPPHPYTKWPLVKVDLTSGNFKLPQQIIALVDSGANISIIHPQIAAFFGYNQTNLDFKADGRSVSGFYKSALISHAFTITIYGYSFQSKFTVIDNPSLVFPCILGQNTIFQWARLDFQGFKSFFEIKFRKDIN